MKKLAILVFFLCACVAVSAQPPAVPEHFETLYRNKYSNIASLLLFHTTNLPKPSEPATWIRDNFVSNDNFELKMEQTTRDAAGNEHKKFSQFYKGIPVEGAVVNLHFRAGVPYSMNGEFYPTVFLPDIVSISDSAALSVALDRFPGALFAWQLPNWERMLSTAGKPKKSYLPEANIVLLPLPGKDSVRFRLAYKFDVYSVAPWSRQLVYVDAENGDILEQIDLLQDMDQKGKAFTKYSGERSITCDESFIYTLQESCRGDGIATFNAGGIFSGLDPSLFEDDDNVWNNINPAQDEIATDLHWGMEQTYDFYKHILGRNSTDDKGYNLIALAHVQPIDGEKFANAMWDGHYAFFGDGDDTSMNPFASIDIVAHEITHGLTQETACLQYKNESGALNESFSDIFGKCVEHEASPESFTWEIGKKIAWKSKPPIRNMKNPNALKDPKFYNGKYFHTGTSDNGGVHCNSSLQNYWFYLICEGGSGFRESDAVPFVVKPVGWDKAIQIAYLNLIAYLTPKSEYKDAALGSVQAAKSLFGETSEEAYNVQMAWYGIGVLDKPQKKDPVVLSELQQTTQAISLFPNPVSGDLHILTDEALHHAQLRIYTLSGRLVRHSGDMNGTLNKIDLSDMAAGMYFMEITQQGSVSRQKLIKL